MEMTDRFYQSYLEELQALEKFRSTHSSLYGGTPLETEDPYTKYLIEALAFFGARARIHGENQITQIHQRLFRGYFSYLVNPLPNFGLLQCKPSTRFPEKVVLRRGSEFLLDAPHQFKATFQTLDELIIFPLFLKKFQFEKGSTGSARCLIKYAYLHPTVEEIGTFKFYINHLSNFFSSLKTAFAMARCLQKVRVLYDAASVNEIEGGECSIRFGCDTASRTVFHHEIEALRSFLHLPQQELFITLTVPPAKKRWETITFCFDFDEKWPENLTLNSDSFSPFIVPIVNLKRAFAEPILSDGTKESYPLLYPEPSHQFELHTVIGVSKVQPQGTQTLTPGMLGGGRESYEIDYFAQTLLLDMPSSFEHPKIVTVDALWTQPKFAEYINDKLIVHFNEVQRIGLEVSLLGPLYKHETTLQKDPHFLIRLLSLKNQSQLNVQEIFFIMQTLKNLENSFFEGISDVIKDCKISQTKNGDDRSVVEYDFFLIERAKLRWETVVVFFFYLHRLLNSWVNNVEIRIKVNFHQNKKVLVIKEGRGNELFTLARDFFLSH